MTENLVFVCTVFNSFTTDMKEMGALILKYYLLYLPIYVAVTNEYNLTS